LSQQVFDFKLRHMRDDIAAIEASNNSLERQARHSAALMRLLEQLLGGLGVDRGLAAALEAPDLKLDRWVQGLGGSGHRSGEPCPCMT
jgi:hypothetical protein